MDWEEFFRGLLTDQPPEPHDYWERLLQVRESDDLRGECPKGWAGVCAICENRDAILGRC